MNHITTYPDIWKQMQLSWEQKDISFLGVNQLDLQGGQTYSICFTPARSYTHHCHWLMTHDCKTIKLSTLASFSPWIPLACGLVRHGICDKRMARFRPCTVRMQLSCRPVPIVPIVPIVPMSPLSPLYPCLLDHLPVPNWRCPSSISSDSDRLTWFHRKALVSPHLQIHQDLVEQPVFGPYEKLHLSCNVIAPTRWVEEMEKGFASSETPSLRKLLLQQQASEMTCEAVTLEVGHSWTIYDC